MSPRCPRQQKGNAAPGNASERHAKNLKEYVCVLNALAEAGDIHVLQRKHLVLFKARVFLDSLLTDEQALLEAATEHGLVPLMLVATVNCMNILVDEAGDVALLDFTTAAVNVVTALCVDVAPVLSNLILMPSSLAGDTREHLLQLAGTGAS